MSHVEQPYLAAFITMCGAFWTALLHHSSYRMRASSIDPVPAARKIEVERRRVFITANLIVVQACRGEIGGCILRFYAVLGVDWCVTGFLAAYPGLGRILANL